MTGADIAADIIAEAARIVREKHGQALTPEEADTLQAAAFLRKIAPYLFEKPCNTSSDPQSPGEWLGLIVFSLVGGTFAAAFWHTVFRMVGLI